MIFCLRRKLDGSERRRWCAASKPAVQPAAKCPDARKYQCTEVRRQDKGKNKLLIFMEKKIISHPLKCVTRSSLFGCFVFQFNERRRAQLGFHAHSDSPLSSRHAEVLARRHHSGSPKPPCSQAVSPFFFFFSYNAPDAKDTFCVRLCSN